MEPLEYDDRYTAQQSAKIEDAVAEMEKAFDETIYRLANALERVAELEKELALARRQAKTS